MPNHVKNRLTVTGPNLALATMCVRAMSKADDGGLYFDFDAYVPMPPELNDTTSGTVQDYGLALEGYSKLRLMGEPEYIGKDRALGMILKYPWAREKGLQTSDDVEAFIRDGFPKAAAEGKLAIRCLKEFGAQDWYTWKIANWGTKWGAYAYEQMDRAEGSKDGGRWEFTFETAWSVAWPVLKVIATEHPNLTFALVYFDEGDNFAGEAMCSPGGRWADAMTNMGNEAEVHRVYALAHGEPYPDYDDDEDE